MAFFFPMIFSPTAIKHDIALTMRVIFGYSWKDSLMINRWEYSGSFLSHNFT